MSDPQPDFPLDFTPVVEEVKAFDLQAEGRAVVAGWVENAQPDTIQILQTIAAGGTTDPAVYAKVAEAEARRRISELMGPVMAALRQGKKFTAQLRAEAAPALGFIEQIEADVKFLTDYQQQIQALAAEVNSAGAAAAPIQGVVAALNAYAAVSATLTAVHGAKLAYAALAIPPLPAILAAAGLQAALAVEAQIDSVLKDISAAMDGEIPLGVTT